MLAIPNHRDTPQEILRYAAETCARRGLRLTTLRHQVLKVLLDANKPLGVYQLIPLLEPKLEHKLGPTTVYRILDFLIDLGMVSRLDGRNAFVPCASPQHAHACLFFVCAQCGSCEEVEDCRIEKLLAGDAQDIHFQLIRPVFEIHGKCSQCL